MTIRRKNKYMRGADEEAFRKQGYSKESLKMLKSTKKVNSTLSTPVLVRQWPSPSFLKTR